jgi:PTH2 family peptidyl-tRNA hydrolase
MIKQVLIIRKDLGMRRGKECSQATHAGMAFIVRNKSGWTPNEEQLEWISTGQTKITLQVNSEEEMVSLFDKAIELGLTANIITDAGRTEFGGVPTKTCLAIGPNQSNLIDQVTGGLKLY